MRPKTLAEVAQLAAGGDSFDRCLANFLDEFHAAPDVGALLPAPELLAPNLGEPGRVRDAYLGATAEQLACAHGFPIPRLGHVRRPQAAPPLVRLATGRLARRLAVGKPGRFPLAQSLHQRERTVSRVKPGE
jgi:hypothetical protein